MPSGLTAISGFAQGDAGWSTIAPTKSTTHSKASKVESGSEPMDAVRLTNEYGPLGTGSGKASGGSKLHPHAVRAPA